MNKSGIMERNRWYDCDLGKKGDLIPHLVFPRPKLVSTEEQPGFQFCGTVGNKKKHQYTFKTTFVKSQITVRID